ncbi:glycosyltransferase [Brenneria uluponensis]|uniref:glycosyltransferase n=1 Tax=Brenneria uluponensis TaxID=3057057 RepID=UPI0028EC669F|nr:glycosyltransferase [Brenneria ulupoensis]
MVEYPLVSIVIPAEDPRYFELALSSAIQQDYENIEIIISDNSTNNLIKNIFYKLDSISRHPISYTQNETPLPAYDNFYQSLGQAQGKYIKFLFDHDKLREDNVRLLVAAMEVDDEVVFASSKRRRIDNNEQLLNDVLTTSYPFRGDCIIQGHRLINFLVNHFTNFIGELSCILCRRDILDKLEPRFFELNSKLMEHTAELTLYVKLLEYGNLAMLSTPLSDIRVDSEYDDNVISGHEFSERDFFAKETKQQNALGSDINKSQIIRVAELDEQHIFYDYNVWLALNQTFKGNKKEETTASWIAKREPKPSESILINNYLDEHPDGRKFGIFIIQLNENQDQVQSTLESLTSAVSHGIKVNKYILSSSEDVFNEYPEFTYKIDGTNYVTALNDIIKNESFDWLMIIRAGELFTVGGLLMTSLGLVTAQSCAAVYGDELVKNEDGELSVACRPDFNLDYFLSLPAVMVRHWLYKREVFIELGGFDNNYAESIEFEFIVRLIEEKGMGTIGHLAEFLTVSDALNVRTVSDEVEVLERHLNRREYINGKVLSSLPGHYRLHYGHEQNPLVSIIIPTKDQLSALAACITSLLERTRYRNYEILIVDNNSEITETQNWLAGIAKIDPSRIKVLSYPHAFNYSAINNLASQEARGNYLLLLNNDTAIIQEDWLDNMLNHALRPEVGIVGAKLLYPDGRIQNAGMILGLRGPIESPFNGETLGANGYMQRLQVDQNYTAVTGSCLMIRKSVYEQVGGLDEDAFKVFYNDADLCLKVRNAGYLTVWTPYALLMHEGRASHQHHDSTMTEHQWREKFQVEQFNLYEKWLPVISRDPAYNINLSLNGRGFEVEPDAGLIWRPLTWRPLPVVMAHMADQTGCGHYRVIKPFNALKNANMIDGKLSNVYLNIPTMARYDPDILVLQRQTSSYFHEWVRQVSRLTNTFKVYELDDYLPNVPLKSVHRANIPKDVVKSMRKSLGFVDRFVVSTAPLAEAFTGLHANIHVVQNKLPLEWWDNLSSLRGQGKKPRVGWGGGSSHTGDLELIVDIVKDLANEVEWIFFGMCPEKLRPYIHEFHKGVDIDHYPAKLASLNLDLALAPLEDNLFNRCKSNLRLMEYGACGFPVICSDIECYHGDLPVTRVRNRYKEWMDAIRMHLSDMDATAKVGDELRAAIYKDWMLDGDNLELWRKAWLPD